MIIIIKIVINTFPANCYLQVKILILKIQLTKIAKTFLSAIVRESVPEVGNLG